MFSSVQEIVFDWSGADSINSRTMGTTSRTIENTPRTTENKSRTKKPNSETMNTISRRVERNPLNLKGFPNKLSLPHWELRGLEDGDPLKWYSHQHGMRTPLQKHYPLVC
jgi:hypothetical protein